MGRESSPSPSGVTPPSDRVVSVVRALGGRAERGDVMRRLAPALGIRDTRSGVTLALMGGRVRLDEDNVLHVVDDSVQELADRCLRGEGGT
jgi:hypothetical protein